jgi:peptide/nickel transport system substrate-binding protein
MRAWVWSIALLAIVTGCTSAGAPGGPAQRSGAAPDSRAGQPKRLVASIQADPKAFNDKVARATSSGPVRGGPELEWLLNSGLTAVDDRGVLHGQIAEAAPSTENGLWVVHPDGRMETTWRIREGAQWHDGVAVTSDDLLFTATVIRDPEIVAFRDNAYELVESVEALDPRTVVVRWKGTTIQADRMFSQQMTVPLPRHLLEQSYQDDKVRFLTTQYWLEEFVGTGPFKLKSLMQGSGAVLTANDRYVLGRPKLDEIEVRFILDPAVVNSNILAGAVHLTLGYAMSLESALEVRRQWPDGHVEIAPNGWIVIHPQMLTPRPAVVGDRRFRGALMHTLNRQEMAETLQFGQVQAADSFLNPAEPEHPAVQSAITRYPYDPALALRTIEEFGYTRGSDGFFVDASGQRPGLEIRVTDGLEIQVKATFAVADYWKQSGFEVRTIVQSPTANNDREETANFPSFRLNRQPNTLDEMRRYLISQAPVAETRFTGFNFARYINQDFNGLIERYFRTVPQQERVDILRQILAHQTEVLSQMGLFYNVQSVAIANRVQHVTNSGVQGFNQAWNAHLWDVQ